MVRTIISVDVNKSVGEQPDRSIFHTRWHPDIPVAAHVKQGEIFRVECLDFSGGQIRNDDDATDMKQMDLSLAHVLSGPIHVEGAGAGDALEVEILDVQPLPGREWGYTGIMDIHNGGGFLADKFPRAHKAIWDFEGIYATSRHIPGVRFAGLIHPGVIGCAPDQKLLETWNKREAELIATNPDANPALAYPPWAKGALIGSLVDETKKAERVKREAARTVPPREHGGNCDIKNLSQGSKLWLPVYVEGAKLSVGDIHFSQGDGEIAFCGGIEMAGAVTLRVRVIKNGINSLALRNPIFLPGPVQPLYSRYLTFEGISVDDSGRQHYLDASISFRQAVLNCIEYLCRFGFTAEQVYLLLSCCPCEGRIASIVDSPNACATLGIPVEIFTDVNILPETLTNKDGTAKLVPMHRGQCATSAASLC